MFERIVNSPANARISLVVCMVVIFILLAVVIALVATRSCRNKDSILQKFSWTIPPPPSIKDEICVYVSSGLFNLYEVMYSIGLKSLADTSIAASVFSDHVPTLYQNAQAYTKEPGKFSSNWFSKQAQANLVVNTISQDIYQIPDGGIAEILRKPDSKMYKKSEGWRSYIPARDGFNMAFFISATINPKVTLPLLQKSLPKLTASMWEARATTLLEAVYGFDMYNLISRCNVCIFNANGIAMDDGSCVELGICTTRGYPCVVHRNELTSNFPAGVINPMVAGAAGYSLGYLKRPTIDTSIALMDSILKSITTQSGQQLDYGHFTPPPKLVSYWCNVGEVVWQWKYTSDPNHYKIRSDGTLDPSSYSDEYINFMTTIGKSNPDLGKSLCVAKICLLIHEVKLKYGVIKEDERTTDVLSTISSNSFTTTIAERGAQGFAGPR